MGSKLLSLLSFYSAHYQNANFPIMCFRRLFSTLNKWKNSFPNSQENAFKVQTSDTFKTYGRYKSVSACDTSLLFLHNKRYYTTYDDDSDEDIEEEAIENYFKQEESLNKLASGSFGKENVFVVQPYLDEDLDKLTTPQLQLDESIALVESLPDYNVIGHYMQSTTNLRQRAIFPEKKFEQLRKIISGEPSISCVFFSVEQLTFLQRIFLEKELEVKKIHDRYTLVLQIFKLRMKTKEAKLQVALAELPYLRANLNYQHYDVSNYQRQGYVGEPLKNALKHDFQIKEKKLQKYLQSLKRRREGYRVARKKSDVPIIAVVGYTNAGKTSLIKALAKAEKIQPKDQLFHTLDVTAHSAIFPNRLPYVLIDTVGFLSNLPHALYNAFNATMEDMLQADLIVHVRDVSHPDQQNQLRKVLTILSKLNLDKKLIQNIVEVRNKIDLLPQGDLNGPNVAPEVTWPKSRPITLKPGKLDLRPSVVCRTSVTNGTGMTSLVHELQRVLMKATNRRRVELVVPSNRDHCQWLRDHCAVEAIVGEGDYQLRMIAIVTDTLWNQFTARFDDVISAHDLLGEDDGDI